MKRTDLWRILLLKADEDLYAVDKLIGHADSPSDVIGFHLQQATEKLLKSLLSFLGINYRHTHHLGELIHLLQKAGAPFPSELTALRRLTPFATEWRYDFLPQEGESRFDRNAAYQMVLALRKWTSEKLPHSEE